MLVLKMPDIQVFLGILIFTLGSSKAAHILGIFPTPDYSHHLIYQPLMRALADRGHVVTVISPEPLKVGLILILYTALSKKDER